MFAEGADAAFLLPNGPLEFFIKFAESPRVARLEGRQLSLSQVDQPA